LTEFRPTRLADSSIAVGDVIETVDIVNIAVLAAVHAVGADAAGQSCEQGSACADPASSADGPPRRVYGVVTAADGSAEFGAQTSRMGSGRSDQIAAGVRDISRADNSCQPPRKSRMIPEKSRSASPLLTYCE
jgi:hypothetical protein